MTDSPYSHPNWVARGNRIRRLVAPHFCATITKVTDAGFEFRWLEPVPVAGSKKLCKGGEVFLDKVARYGYTLFEGLGGQESLVWGERMWRP